MDCKALIPSLCFLLLNFQRVNMRQWKLLLTLMISLLYLPIVLAQSPVGVWNIMDEKTGKKRVLVDLFISNGELFGKILNVFPQPGDTGICSKCPDNFKNKPIKGIQFIWGLQDKGNGV